MGWNYKNVLIILFGYLPLSLGLLRCPYPLASSISPCTCELDLEKRMILSCNTFSFTNQEFLMEDFARVTSAFDYNNLVHTFKIEHSIIKDRYIRKERKGGFHGQLKKDTLGRLNVTKISFADMIIMTDFFGSGAFDGSFGSIEEISIAIKNAEGLNHVELKQDILKPACPTLQTLILYGVSYLASLSFEGCSELKTLSLYESNLLSLSSGVFANLPNLQSIIIASFLKFSIETGAFLNLNNLTELTIRSLGNRPGLSTIKTRSFENLPILTKLEFWYNVDNIEKEAFKDLTSLEEFKVVAGKQESVHKLFTNSPYLSVFSFGSGLINVDEEAFEGISNLKTIDLARNMNIKTLKLKSLEKLNSFELNGTYLESAEIIDLENLTTLTLSNRYLRTLKLNGVPNLMSLTLRGLTTLQKETFQPVIQNMADLNGTVNMLWSLDCGCDVKWLLGNASWVQVFKNAKCSDNQNLLEKVNASLLEELCPPYF